MKAEPLSFGISPDARRRLDAEAPGADYVPVLRLSVAPRVEIVWRLRDSDAEGLRTFQNDLGEEVALEGPALASRLQDQVLHHTGREFVLLSGRSGRPRVSDRGASTVTAGKVKLLREQTGFPMMACKRALEATNGDLDAAHRLLRGSR